MKLYADPITVNCRKVLAALHYLDIPFELELVNFFSGEHKEPGYLSVNPNGTLPTMVDQRANATAGTSDFVLWESNAILQYAADVTERADAYPTELQARANVNRWLLWEAASWFPTCYVYLVQNCAKPLAGEEPDQVLLNAHHDSFHNLASILDRVLSQQPWLGGETLSIADLAVAAPLHLHQGAKIPLAQHKNLHRWMIKSIEPLPCWEQTYVGPDFSLTRPQK